MTLSFGDHKVGTTLNLSQFPNTLLKYILKAIPDIQYTINSMISEGDLVAVNSTATGMIKDGFMGIRASGKKVRFKQMFFFRLVNNKIAEEWEVVDVAGLKDQLSK